ncbi:hypothetical protein SELMODRAFT_236021 [Selaginella moellendorffii]|uniref:Calpain catalytic domain-containing protein n=1 Tax=Selaginella moellendorffii TaxID=88036 RepID=D8T469_SELML|nr:hypothetical protein SELMODRAFT_236021 [Selaginella moellendorffii]
MGDSIEAGDQHSLIVLCAVCGTLFSVLSALSVGILFGVNWRPWRIYSWVFARKWPSCCQGSYLSIAAALLALTAWLIVLSPVAVLVTWGVKLVILLDRDTIGLAVILPGTALLLAFYAIMLWWRTQWQSSRAVAVLLLLAVSFLCAYEFSAVYVTAGRSASKRYSASGFFFGVSAIALAINMLFICKMVFHGSGIDVDEYVRRSYKFAYADGIEVGPVACMPEPPDPKDAALQKPRKTCHLALLYSGSIVVLVAYSILYALTAQKVRWLGGVTSAAVIILDANVGACLFGFQLLKSRVVALFVAGIYRVFLICFGVHLWYLGHCVSYAVVACVLLGAAVCRHLSVVSPSAARRAALQPTVIRLREGFRKRGGSSSSFSEGRDSSAKRSSSVEATQIGLAFEAMNRSSVKCHQEGNGTWSHQSGAAAVNEDSTESSGTGKALEISRSFAGLASAFHGSVHHPTEGPSIESSASGTQVLEHHGLDPSLALAFQEKLNDPRLASMLKGRNFDLKRKPGEQDLTTLLEDKGLDPNFAVMLKERGLDPTILALLQRSSLDADRDHRDNSEVATTAPSQSQNAVSEEAWAEELRRQRVERWVQRSSMLVQLSAGTPERAWLLFSVFFVLETVIIGVFRPNSVTVINATHEQFDKSSILLGLALTVPSMTATLAIALPIWVRNGFRFYIPVDGGAHCSLKSKEGIMMTVAIAICVTSIFALGVIISFKPLDDLEYASAVCDISSSGCPYASSFYIGWAVAASFALVLTGLLPAVSWFATYRFSLSSAVCVGLFIVVLLTFCGGSYLVVLQSREGNIPLEIDFLVALLPLICIPAMFSLGCGLYKWKDEGWHLSKGVYIFVGIGLILLLGAISAVIATINPWMVGVAFLLFLLLLILAIGVIHHWASHNFYMTRLETLLVCLAAFVLALAAFLVGLLAADEPFVGASVGYFSFLFLLAGRALTVLLSPPVVVYSPRVLPVYVYDAHADSAKNVSAAFLVLYCVALAAAGWGVVASLEIYPPFAGAAVSAITLVVAFGFAVSRPCITLKMMDDAVQFLGKDTIVQAIARSSTKTRNALSGTYSAPQRSASSAALLVGDPTVPRDKAGNFVLPRADVLKLRERLRNEERAAGLWWRKKKRSSKYRHEPSPDVGFRRKMCAHARILTLEEAIDTEWVYMWDKFGGYLLLILGLAAKAERVQDEVRLRLFLDSIGFSDLSAKKIHKWTPEDRKQFELVQESYMREREMEEELIFQRREEEGKGKERRKALLEKEERRRREMEASVISSVPDVGSKEAAAMAAAVRAVGGGDLLDESGTHVSSIARRILSAQRARRAQQTGVPGAICVIDDEPRTTGRHCGTIDAAVCGFKSITCSAAIMVQPQSGPVCILGTESCQKICLEILIAGAEQNLESGQVGIRLVLKGPGHTMTVRERNIGNTDIADGRWHTVAVTVDATTGEVAAYLDGMLDGTQSGLQIPVEGGIWQRETEVWVGSRPPMDLDAFGRSDSEGVEASMHIMDVFLWGRCLKEEELLTVHNANVADYSVEDLPDDDWQSGDSPIRLDDWGSEAADLDLYDREEGYWEEQAVGRKRKPDKDSVVIEMDYLTRKLRRPRAETNEEVNQRMRSVELAVKEALAARGELQFTDQEFPPTNQSLFINPEQPLPKLQVVQQWVRPAELVRDIGTNARPRLFEGFTKPADVCQGRLGDCWFLSAVAVLTAASRISEVIITPEYNEEGIYTVRFCIQGEWVPVVVDDWIPCEFKGKPAFATSRKRHELWVSVLEKAYAKLHGSYEALEGGHVQDALVDLTGGAGEEIDLTSAQAQLDLASGRLWSQLLRFKQEGFLLGAGSPSGSDAHVSASGIVQGHAYSLLQVREVDGHKLVQICNPWANEVEWNGPWSDSSLEWTDRMKHKLKYSPQAQDGVFWMSWQDFQLHFRSVYVCRIYPPEMRYSVRGQWRGGTAGGCQDFDSWHYNPQFRLKAVGSDARKPVHVFVTLTQGVHFSSRKRAGFEYQSSGDTSMFYIGMRILKTRGKRAKYNIFMHESVGGTDYVNSREISCEMVLEPDPRGYTIVPTTFAPHQEAPFVLSVFTKASITLEPL